MLFNKRWIDELVPNELSADQLCDKITMAGLEVDSSAPVCGEFSKVVVAEVLDCWPHPDSDHMHVTKIDAGTGEVLQIVCGAPNVRTGLKVCCAVNGAKVGDLKIKPCKLRGVESNGMLCSYRELGMAEESDGIIELPDDAPVGVDIHEYMKLDDVVVDVDLTTNRADCLGILGIAREVAVLTGSKLNYPEFEKVKEGSTDTFPVEVIDKESCPRYECRVIRGINQKAQSPLWMTERLRRCGLRAVSPVVDVTNYVMLEYSQPLHSFDLNKLNDKIVIRKACAGEKIKVLSGEEINLKDNTLIIADAKGPVAIAGIFGGENSGIDDQTTDVLLESAFFAPDAIKGRARQYGLDTDASHRFERGVDHANQRRAMERATQLLIEIAGGVAGPVTEAVCEETMPRHDSILLRTSKLEKVLGEKIPADTIEKILENLELKPQRTDEGFLVISPSFRFDIAIEEDIIEEVARIYGYDNIPNTTQVGCLNMASLPEENVSDDLIKHTLADAGYNEAITYSFTHPDLLKVFNDIKPLMLTSPISPELSAMRTTLLAALCNAVKYNRNRQQSRVRLFEQGLTYIIDEKAENGVRQEGMIAGVISGDAHDENWSESSRNVDFFDVKGDLEKLLGITCRASAFSLRPTVEKALHPGQGADIYLEGKKVGYVGMLHPVAQKALGLKNATGVFEIERSALGSRAIPSFRALSKFPSVRRDFAFLISRETPVEELLQIIRTQVGADLSEIRVFDVFEDEKLGDKRSVALGVVMQNAERTLEESDVEAYAQKIVEAASVELGATLRS